jgi:hypothetical protein
MGGANHGYVDDLFAAFRTRIQGLELAKLGCSRETTTTMIQGGICNYSQRSQLARSRQVSPHCGDRVQ